MDVKARFLCHALIKTFLLEQQLEQLDPSPERIMSRSGEDSDVSTIQAVKNINYRTRATNRRSQIIAAPSKKHANFCFLFHF